MKALLLTLLLLGCGWALADADPRIAQLEAAYNRIHQEQMAVFQQFQMTQEMRRNELEKAAPTAITSSYPAIGMDNSRSLDYDENIRLQQAQQERLRRYDRDISQTYARYLELGERKKALLEQIMALSAPSGR